MQVVGRGKQNKGVRERYTSVFYWLWVLVLNRQAKNVSTLICQRLTCSGPLQSYYPAIPSRSQRVVYCSLVFADSLGLMEVDASRGSEFSARLWNGGIAVYLCLNVSFSVCPGILCFKGVCIA